MIKKKTKKTEREKEREREREREKTQKEDLDEKRNRAAANGKSAGFMTMMACEPLGHGLLKNGVGSINEQRLPTFSLSPLAFIILAASLRPVAFSSHLCT